MSTFNNPLQTIFSVINKQFADGLDTFLSRTHQSNVNKQSMLNFKHNTTVKEVMCTKEFMLWITHYLFFDRLQKHVLKNAKKRGHALRIQAVHTE